MADSGNEGKPQSALDAEIEARHTEVLGHPQRMAPLERTAEAEAMAVAYWRKLRRSIYGEDDTPPAGAKIPEIHFTMLRCPELWECISGLSVQLSSRGQIPVRDRELVILRTGWLCRAPFEWGEHVRIGRLLGLDGSDIERIIEGSTAQGWSEHERALLQAVEELHADAMISDQSWAVLSRKWSDTQLFELAVLVGQFTTVAYWQNSLRVPLGGDNAGLAAR
ncbi:MAG: carboxymuconolactone decarboxylase family protein [Halieaceae bacterium]|nr:carboxymuconolactone decarboxylase family protein [Halieaceae bacterium]